MHKESHCDGRPDSREELAVVNIKTQDIINAIPGGVAVYKVSDIFETVYFTDGVPELTGYTPEEYRELMKADAAEFIYREDAGMVVEKAKEIIRTRGISSIEFRKQHRDGRIVWVRVQVKWIGEEEGCPLLCCVFHNISDFKESQLEMDHLINSIPGGIASYVVENNQFIPTFFSDGVMSISGHTREEYNQLIANDALDIIYERDRERVLDAAKSAVISGEVLDVSYRMRHKDGYLIWIHLNGRRMGPLSESTRFYAVFTGMSSETRMYQSIANETADGIYVIDKKNYDLLYLNESRDLFNAGQDRIGQKCYAALHGKSSPCEFCTLKTHKPDGEEHEMLVDGTDRYYNTRFRETDWNGIPAYIRFVQDITGEVKTRKEKERLEQYFQTVLRYLPGGVAVIRLDKDGGRTIEFVSDGFAKMTGTTQEETLKLYENDAMAGIHPDDRAYVAEQLKNYMDGGGSQCEVVYRLAKGGGTYIWVKNSLALIKSEGGESRVYAMFQDITKDREERVRIRRQYNDLIMQHIHTQDAGTMVLSQSNISKNQILEVIDHTDAALLKTFGPARENFFRGLCSMIVDEKEQKKCFGLFMNKSLLELFGQGEKECSREYFIKLPYEDKGRYVQFKVKMMSAPDSGDVTGVFTLSDITSQTVSDKILHSLTASGYEFVADIDLEEDSYVLLTCNEGGGCIPRQRGCHSKWVRYMSEYRVVPRDRERFTTELDTANILDQLNEKDSYTFSYSIIENNGDIRTKNMTVSAVDLRIGRICLSRTDITDSVREQQALLHVIAYTFELVGFIDIISSNLTMHTRETVLNNLPPYFVEDYNNSIIRFVEEHGSKESRKEAIVRFQIATMKKCLEEKEDGYDFLFPYMESGNERYKQINVMWGDENHRTICIVRADVTDMVTAERENRKELEDALILAEEASRAKSDFMSAMSHDIRTPMNAIMGMTTLAARCIGDGKRVGEYLQKIAVSSKHLLSLINDILDMSKIERAQITLNRMKMSVTQLLDGLSAIIAPQADQSGLKFAIDIREIKHGDFYGDSLRLNQIFINILSNAVKYTPEGGKVDFAVEEITPALYEGRNRYRFTVSDTGVGMSEEFLTHVFEPFARSKDAIYTEGTGLGLSITKGLVDLMGGAIHVESSPGKGTEFQVEIECERAEAVKVEKKGNEENRDSDIRDKSVFMGRKFLVAEDNQTNAEILSELLAIYGARTVVVPDGRKTVEELQSAEPGTYDAVLMDIQMPKMNGYDATRAIRALGCADLAEIPIIAMTANAFSEDVQTALHVGMNAHVSKPVDMDVLKETLKKVLEGR